ncbi:tellurite resistance/C4-dicarboxylate transporter family protein [Hymenobacter sp. YC55]|uniref:tellurite resistance/C4-dicarboxylate transporter family protein n=1 Tax=Hymenobacter sp. YC55 TaxID=3034019 RepID=UPI0023FA401D|nr:tellurite resistance/C4-dicarboxylate transporter family protein [Hymenobacter sp. YC55]MDF7815631.1 tellurite resistance/C4-dicarboxylate transporter family protein [Hymenobacter sp. YC55]
MLKSIIEKFPPAYFAFVMATGIISLAAHAQHIAWLAESFFYLNLLLYPLFLLLLAARILLFAGAVKAELASHEQGPNFLALVAATCLVGNQFVQLRGNQVLGLALWVFGALCWLVLLYGFLLSTTLKRDKPKLETGLDANWLLLTVSTQALAVLGAGLVPKLALPTDVGIFLVLCLFLLGSLFYGVLCTLLFYRLAFKPIEAQKISPPYWIIVGGSAITVMAGATLLSALPHSSALADATGFVKAWSVLFWVISTWWIPFVLVLRGWHHLHARPTFSYQPSSWSMVFPLGMYAASTGRLADALPLAALHTVSSTFIWLALLAWGLTLAGMLVHYVASTQSDKSSSPART